MAKRILSEEELEIHLKEQLQFLQLSTEAYDKGYDAESKRLALTIRILVHKTPGSHPLLGQLKKLDTNFLSTAIPPEPGNQWPHGGLIMVAANKSESKYVAMLDDVPCKQWLPFSEWWDEPVFVDETKNILSRSKLICIAANQDGGAHVDPAIEELYAKFSKDNGMGWSYTENKVTTFIPLAEKAAIRQISHEVLKTLISGYEKYPEHKADMFFGGMQFTVSHAPPF